MPRMIPTDFDVWVEAKASAPKEKTNLGNPRRT